MHFFNEEYFPTKEQLVCPPADSHQFSGMLYRFSRNYPESNENDWKAMTKNNNKREKWEKANDYARLCIGAGLSCFKTEGDAKKAYQSISSHSKGAARKFKGIFPVQVKNIDGVLAETSNPRNPYKHFTFWINKESKIDSISYSCNCKLGDKNEQVK